MFRPNLDRSRNTRGMTCHAAATLALMGLCILSACAAPHSGKPEIVTADDSRRDTQAARKLHAQAIVLMEAGEYAKAQPLLEQAIKADTFFGPAHNSMGVTLFKQKQLYKAAWQFQYASQLMPHQPEPRNNLGLVFEEAGQMDKAVEWFSLARDMAPDNPEFLGNLARARIVHGERSKALRSLLQEIILKDTRPQWVEWAKEQLAMMGGVKDE